MVYTRPPLIDIEEKPVPTFAFQSCFGPSGGQELNQPVSLEMPFASGPRQRGQSSAVASNQDKAPRLARNKIATRKCFRTDSRLPKFRMNAGGNMAGQLTQAGAGVNRVALPTRDK